MSIEEFLKTDFNTTLLIPLKTTLQFDGESRQVVRHNNSNFIWVNGNEKCYPLIIVPVSELENDILYGYSKTKIMTDVLEYLSLLNVRFGIKADIHQMYFKNYFGIKAFIVEQEPWIPRADLRYFEYTKAIPQYITELTEQESLLIGLFRDGFNNDNIFYSFLSFFKIFENYFPNYEDRNNWIEMNLSNAKELWLERVARGLGDWEKFLKFVEKNGRPVGVYFYKTCRVATAHARHDPLINPNNFTDYYEMYYANEVIKTLAWYLILTEFTTKLKIN